MGGVVKGAFNAVKSVVKYGINMVKSVIKDPLPTILTIGLNFVAPGLGSLTGLPTWAVKGIGRAAISAANGGSLAGIVAAGITPYFNSPTFQNTMVGGLLKDASSFISAPIKNLLGDNWVSNVVSSSLTDSSVAGLIAAVSGQDIMKAMGSEFVTSAVTAGIGKAWDALKTEVPKLLQTEEQINQKSLDAKIMKDTTPVIGKVQSLQYNINKNVTEANQLIDEYNEIEKKATVAYDRANLAETQSDYDTNIAEYLSYEKELNNKANLINQLYVPTINEEKAILEAEYNNPESKGLIDEYISKLDEVGQLNKSYELGVGKVLAENADFKMTEAIAKGDFTEASKFYNELETFNKQILSLDPNAIAVAPSLDLNSQNLLKDIYSATDETLKNQLISQANLNQQFTDIRTNAPPIVTPTTPAEPETPAIVEPTPTEPTVPETPAPVQPTPVTPVVPETPITDDRAPGYGNLPTLPEGGIGQPTPSVPTTTTPPTTPSTGTGSNIIDNVIGGAGNLLENAINKAPTVIENALIGGATNAVVNEILGNKPPTRPTINKPRPPAKVDVGTLRPYTGSLFGETTAPTTPVGGLPTTPPSKVDPSTLTPYTGSLSVLGQTTTPPTNTTTQTPSGGLQSTQTQTPPTKVDVSRLTPVTDTNLLKSLGIA